jgi:hypothetical protein
VLLTADLRIRSRQNLVWCRVALVVLSSTAWPNVKNHIAEIAAAITAATPGSYQQVAIRIPPKRRQPGLNTGP